MNLRSLAIVLIRLYACLLLLGCLTSVEQVIRFAFAPKEAHEAVGNYWSLYAFFSLSLHFAIAIFLLIKSEIVAKIAAPSEIEMNASVDIKPEDLAVVGFSLAGIVFFVNGLESILSCAAAFFTSPSDRMSGMVSIPFETPRLFIAMIKTLIGIGLFAGAKGMVRLAYWARRAGTQKDN